MRIIIYIFCLFLTFSAFAQTKTAPKKKTTPANTPAKKAKSKPAVEFEKKELTAEQKVTLTKMAYDIYRTQMDVKPSLLDNQMVMGDVVMPNSLTITPAEIHNTVEVMKKGFSVKLHKATSFVTVAGVPQNNAYWATVYADCKMLPYSRYVDFDSKWFSVKTKKGIDIMTMNEKDQKKENGLSSKTINNHFSYNLIVDYKPGDSIPKHVLGDVKVSIPKKFEVLELKKLDVDKEYSLGKTKIKLLKLLARNYAIQVEGDDPSLKMIVISDENKQFLTNNIAHISLQQYAVFRQPEILNEETLNALGTTVNDINDINRVKVGKVQGKGKILKIVIFRAIELEKIDLKLDLNHIEVIE
jgi:hypothetical protein